ncbi:hypothetical protein [Parahaliea aestuarii]|uniref:EamA family transporter n=1 Tax=Parahaliea aestuarii TaxID=1852021 RepID=A0A5C8ZNQ6_9GAMM|nr:hypothetical protein [Parahaliea aestuarii]TXS89394.1 hypothetical protein FVW59_17920 [Parahaliea aestuarii]
MTPATLALLLTAALCASGGQLLFKIGASGRTALLEFINLPIVAGLALYAAATVLWIYVLSTQALTTVYAFTVLTFALVYLGGVFLLGERLSPGGMAGTALVLLGLFCITRYG